MVASRFIIAAAAASVAVVLAECPSACSGNGDCGPTDSCACYDGFIGADCSGRTCPYASAFVDVPNGDLNHDGFQGTTTTPSSYALAYSKVQWNSYKQPEYWPTLAGYVSGSAGIYKSDGTGLDPNMVLGGGWAAAGDEAHFYAECAGKGVCDRTAGACTCFDGFSGAACQRTTCPSDCSGHGVCRTVREIAATKATKRLIDSYAGVSYYAGPQDYFTYRLWDGDKNRACACDPGYGGIDCTLRDCPRGDDPLTTTPSTCGGAPCANEVQAFAVGGNQAGGVAGMPVNYKLRFYDYNGFAFTTSNFAIDTYLDYHAPANAVAKAALQASIAAALQALPNNATGAVTVTVTGDGTNVAYPGNANIMVAVTFTTLSGNVPDMNVIPGDTTAAAAAGTPAVAQPFNRMQIIVLNSAVVQNWHISATLYPLNTTNIRKDSTLATDDTTSAAAVTVGAGGNAAAAAAAVLSAVQAVPAIAYFGAASVSATAYPSGSTWVVTLVLPNANFGANPVQLAITNAGSVPQPTAVVSVTPMSVDGNKEFSVCSNRGVCDSTTGMCSCFTGYYGNACDTQSALAM